MVKASLIRTAAYFAAVAGVATLQTTDTATAQQVAAADQTRIDKGKVSYAEKCSHCHGRGMLTPGTVAPDLRKFPDDKERFFSVVKLGKNNKMPPWGDVLNDEEIAELWAYTSSQRKP